MKLTFKQVILYILSGWLILVGIQSATTQALPGGLTPTTPFTGRLINSTGQIVSDGEYRIRVRVFNAESGGTQLFEELFDSQTSYNGQVCPKQKTQNGYFRLEMGSCNILSSDAFKALYNNTSLFIEIAIDFDEDGTYEEVFAPRRRIGIQAGAVSALQLVSDGNGTSTNALSIDGQGHLQFEGIGRLGWGIGGAQPQSTLEVNDATNASRLQLYGAGDGLSFSSIQLGRNTRGSASWFMHHRQIAGETGNLAIEEFDGTNYNQRLTIRPGGNVGIGTTSPSARLQVQGSGTTSATTALNVTNSAGTSLFSVRDSGLATFSGGLEVGHDGSWGRSFSVTLNRNASGEVRYHSIGSYTGHHGQFGLSGQLGGHVPTSMGAQLLNILFTGRSGFKAQGTRFGPVGSSADIIVCSESPQLYSSPQYRIYLQSSTWALANLEVTHRSDGWSDIDFDPAIYTTNHPCPTGQVFSLATWAPDIASDFAGNVGIGTTAPTARLQVQGAGTTSATTALNVTNSSGTSLFSVRDDGLFQMGNFPIRAATRLTLKGDENKSAIRIEPDSHLSSWSVHRYPALTFYATQDAVSRQNLPLDPGSGGYPWRGGASASIVFVDRPGRNTAWGHTARSADIEFWTAVNWNGSSYGTYSAPRMIISHVGNVGIGTTSPSYNLHVNGSVAGVGGYVNLSDEFYKKNVYDINYGINELKQLRPVKFNWINPDYGTRTNLGFIAQEVELVMPEIVITANDGIKSMASTDLIPVLTKAVQEQQTQISDLTQQIYQGIIVDPNFNWDNTNKRLGIGTTTTNSRLTVRGAGSTLSTSSLDIQNSLANSLLFVRDDGWIGIGTTDPQARLDVRGGVRVGEDSSSCSSSNSGTIRYDQSTNSLQVCNEKEWITFSSVANGSSIEQAAVSCEYIKIYYPTLPNGMFWIDPDGTGNIEPSQVYCELTSGS